MAPMLALSLIPDKASGHLNILAHQSTVLPRLLSCHKCIQCGAVPSALPKAYEAILAVQKHEQAGPSMGFCQNTEKQVFLQGRPALVALWMTNRERHWRFVEDELLPAWGLTPIGTWHWLKVADNGRPLCPLVCLQCHNAYRRFGKCSLIPLLPLTTISRQANAALHDACCKAVCQSICHSTAVNLCFARHQAYLADEGRMKAELPVVGVLQTARSAFLAA